MKLAQCHQSPFVRRESSQLKEADPQHRSICFWEGELGVELTPKSDASLHPPAPQLEQVLDISVCVSTSWSQGLPSFNRKVVYETAVPVSMRA